MASPHVVDSPQGLVAWSTPAVCDQAGVTQYTGHLLVSPAVTLTDHTSHRPSFREFPGREKRGEALKMLADGLKGRCT